MTETVPRLRGAIKRLAPGLSAERELWGSGAVHVAGMDEVGRGAWAGPITVGAAIVPRDRRVYKIRDSKLLTESEREALFDRVASWCVSWAVGHAGPEECDELGMSEAQKTAARRAIEGLAVEPDAVLFDGRWNFTGSETGRGIVGGDRSCLSIAAASILAKVTRDRLMRKGAPEFPHWSFDSNKGYPDPRHKAALCYYGPSAIHRTSWVFMDHLPYPGVERFRRPEPQQRLFD